MFLIDVNNLWYAAMERKHPLAGISRSDLVTILDHWAGRVDRRVVLVLDGPGADTAGQAERVYSHGRSADSVIRRWVGESSDPRRITVVSSDRALGREVRKRRVTLQSAEDFADRLERWLHRPAAGGRGEPASKHAGLGGGRDQIRDWLAYFNLHPAPGQCDIIGGDSVRPTAGESQGTSDRTSPDACSESTPEDEDAQQREFRRAFGDVLPLKRRNNRDA